MSRSPSRARSQARPGGDGPRRCRTRRPAFGPVPTLTIAWLAVRLAVPAVCDEAASAEPPAYWFDRLLLLLLKDGDTRESNALFRQLIYQHYAAKRNGRALLPTLFCNTCFTRGGGWLNECNASNQISLIEAYAPLAPSLPRRASRWPTTRRSGTSSVSKAGVAPNRGVSASAPLSARARPSASAGIRSRAGAISSCAVRIRPAPMCRCARSPGLRPATNGLRNSPRGVSSISSSCARRTDVSPRCIKKRDRAEARSL